MNRCDNCGAFDERSLERCEQCGAFASLLPVAAEQAPPPARLSQDASEIAFSIRRHVRTGFAPWDKALGGGLVPGSTLVLFGGPGARKTTWAGAMADSVASALRGRALFLCPEMPADYVRDAVARIRTPRALSIVGADRDASNLEACMRELQAVRPRVVVYDSIQSFDTPRSSAGSDWAIKATVLTARKLSARTGHVAILISQVNAQGRPSGPHRTIHDCDTIVHLEPDAIRVIKNRHAPTLPAVPIG